MSTLTSTGTIGLRRGGIEVLQLVRDRTALIFTFFFPAMLLLLFGVIFGGETGPAGVGAAQIFTASMIAYGIVSTSFEQTNASWL